MAKKRELTKSEIRNIRMQRIIFVIVSVFIVLAMVLSLVAN
jgi:preprotein translocase subunit SecG